ncbi:MAG: NAD-glutamate dehydrogenase domain-containing protein [Baekduia sp.]
MSEAPPEYHALLPAFVGGYWGQSAGAAVRDAGGGSAALEEARGALGLAAGRGTDAITVRAFNPEPDTDGYGSPGSALETNTPDLPFLVDSVSAEIVARGIRIVRVVHPIIWVVRDEEGRIVALGDEENGRPESIMHFELGRRLTDAELADLAGGVRGVLANVTAVVSDFEPMRASIDRLIGIVREDAAEGDLVEDDPKEIEALLQWLLDENFVFLGYREEREGAAGPEAVPGTALGLLRDVAEGGLGLEAELDIGDDSHDRRALRFLRSHAVSTVHRREPMETLLVRIHGPGGGVARLLGILSSRAVAEPASRTPQLRDKLARILSSERLVHGSHDYKAAIALFDRFPKAELLAAPVEDLRRIVKTLIGTAPNQVRLTCRVARHGRAAALVASMPRERLTPDLVQQIRALISDAFNTTYVESQEVFSDDGRALVHLFVRSPDPLPEVDVAPLEEEIRRISRTWADRLAEQLAEDYGAERGPLLAARWIEHLPDGYRAETPPEQAAKDIDLLERLAAAEQGTELLVGLQDGLPSAGRLVTRIALYKRGPKVELTAATPLLENHGLRVIDEHPTRIEGQAGDLWVQAFSVMTTGGEPLDVEQAAGLAESLEAVWHGQTESDSLNRLVLAAGLAWPRVQVLRALQRYRQRVGSRYTEEARNDAFVAHPRITARLEELFELRFAVDPPPAHDEREQALKAAIVEELDAVELLDHDRILRNQLALVEAVVRTNVYRPDRGAMSFKIRSADVPMMPAPAPLFEIFVYASDLEGIHLRGGPIARGGIRWSDRMDYRTEVFGLMRAQMTKNAVIVPAGAKGGFYLKAPPADPTELREAVKAGYERYIEALLDVTDDLDPDGTTIHPDGVRVRDGADSYFVVAADKGTATFSDTANAIAVRRGFWLGDAFASGGSNGYDHKKLGITARSAWESVKRHFRELGVDPESDPITAVGIGDMSGDVFGNGMLLSRSLRLIAAYDHRHVFIDPNPSDAARSWEERKRLFDMPGSSWADYDSALISEGGGVFPRNLKSVPVTPQIQAALGIEASELTPAELIQAVLRAPVDLLWNGGIGTVVRASHESDADARDRASDAIRISADQLRCRVVGEGGNLGFTHRARIEAAQRGILLFADFIDNSGGVDSSDHEVNLKILLDLVVRRGSMTPGERDSLLAEVTGDVVDHVLHDSFLQAQILSQEVAAASHRMYLYEDLMTTLESAGIARREDEALPSSDEVADRRRLDQGLVRPELAVLVACAKLLLTGQLLESDVVTDAAFDDELRGYFPPAVVERVGPLLTEHPLRRELVATLVANDVVNSMGPAFASDLAAEHGVSGDAVVRCYRIARDAVSAERRWAAIEDDLTLTSDISGTLMEGVDLLVGAVTRWYLRHDPDADIAAAAAALAPVIDELDAAMPSLRDSSWCSAYDEQRQSLAGRGAPPELADSHARQQALYHAADIALVARETGRPAMDVAKAFFAAGALLDLERLEHEILALPGVSSVHRWAQQALLDDTLTARRELAAKALASAAGEPEEAVAAYLDARPAERARLVTVMRALGEGSADASTLAFAIRHLRALA